MREDLADESADFRMWGGGSHTAQNQRLVYWPMLKSGDFDLMPPQFEYYRRGLPGAEARTRLYWGHEGCSFTEQLENFGIPIGWGWGWLETPDPYHKRTPFSDPTEQQAPWIRYLYLSQLEFALMILKYRQYSGLDIAPYLPFIESAIRFFDAHYQWQHRINAIQPLDENGHLVLFPSTACETYKDALNPVDLVSGLQCTVEALLEIGSDLLSEEAQSLLSRPAGADSAAQLLRNVRANASLRRRSRGRVRSTSRSRSSIPCTPTNATAWASPTCRSRSTPGATAAGVKTSSATSAGTSRPSSAR